MICITGTPGTGKTTIAKKLSMMTGLPLIGLNEWMLNHLQHETDETRGAEVIDESQLSHVHIDGIVDGHLSHFCDCDVIVLIRCSDQKEHLERMKKKGFGQQKAKENMEAELMEVVAEEARQTGKPLLEIDSSDMDAEQVASKINEWLTSIMKKER